MRAAARLTLQVPVYFPHCRHLQHATAEETTSQAPNTTVSLVFVRPSISPHALAGWLIHVMCNLLLSSPYEAEAKQTPQTWKANPAAC